MRFILVIICALNYWSTGNGKPDGYSIAERSSRGRPKHSDSYHPRVSRETVTEVTKVNGDEICGKKSTLYNVVWRCESETVCPISPKYLKSWKEHTYCGTLENPEGIVPKVCCPYKAPDESKQSDSLENDSRNIAREKCEDYSKFRFVMQSVGGNVRGTSNVTKRVLDCGKTTESLITGGRDAVEKEFPHMALLGWGDDKETIEWSCGGSLISSDYILSAAHCNNNPRTVVKWALLGKILKPRINEKVNEDNLYRIEARFNHPEYDSSTSQNDITLLKLERAVKFSPSIRPICLVPPSVVTSTPDEVVATGWGQIAAGFTQSDNLLKVKLDRLDDNSCRTSYQPGDNKLRNGYNATIMMCAGNLTYSKDTCEGDSGGPLQYKVNHSDYKCVWIQEGITSVGPVYCGSQSPSVYTRVSTFLSWIQPIVWPVQELTHS